MKPLLLLFVVLAAFATGNATQCYQCISPATQCNDSFDETNSGINKTTYPTNCACVKEVLTLSFGTITQRDCVDPSELLGESRIPSIASSRLDATAIKSFAISFCYTDLCNGARSIPFALSTLIVIVAPFAVSNWH